MVAKISTQNLNIISSGTLDKNKAAMQKDPLVTAGHYDTAKTFLIGLDTAATVRIVNGRSKGSNLMLSTQSNKGNFYSRKPVTTEFFKQACIAKFSNGSNQLDIEKLFDQRYQDTANQNPVNSAGHFRAVMIALESEFASQDLGPIQAPPDSQPALQGTLNVNDQIRNLSANLARNNGESQDTNVRNQLITLLKTGGQESESKRADFLREHTDTLSNLFYFDLVSTIVTDQETADDLASLRNERDALPEFAQIKLTLQILELEYTDPITDESVTMPWYLLRASDGTIAALSHPAYSHLQLSAPNDQLMTSVQIFKTQNGEVTHLPEGQKKHQEAHIVTLFPLLNSFFNTARVPSACSALAQQLFASDPEIDSCLQRAIRGIRQKLSDSQKIQLGAAFMRGAEGILQDPSLLDNPDRWPEAKLTDDFLAQLRQQAWTTSQVGLKEDRAFAHFLFGLSATFTRLGSVASLGNDDDSITQLRYLGYVFSKTAQTLQPKLFAEGDWTRVNNQFLNRNDCAALLSEFQLKISKELDAGEFQRFVPQVFRDPGL